MGSYTFTNTEIQQKATILARTSQRPARYNTQKSRIALVKHEIIKDELIRQGYLRMVQEHLPAMIAAHIDVAKMASPKGTAERKLMFQAVGLLDERKGEQETAGNVLGQLFASFQKRGVTTFDPYEYE
jgi:hypothetical protein